MSLRVGIEAHYLSKVYTGLGITQLQFVQGVSRAAPDIEFTAFTDPSGEGAVSLSMPNVNMIPIRTSGTFLRFLAYKREARRRGLDAFVFTNNLCIRVGGHVKVLSVTHDFAHGRYDRTPITLVPGLAYHLIHLASIAQSDWVFARSRFILSELRKLAPLDIPCSVLYTSCHPLFATPVSPDATAYLRDLGLERFRYIIIPGRTEPSYKNLQLVLLGLQRFLGPRMGFKVVLVHNDSFPGRFQRFIQEVNMPVLRLHQIETARLRDLYAYAAFCLYASLYEGFGIPILEAQTTGCPIILANTPVAHEVGGRGAVYVDQSPVALADAMESIIENREARSRLSRLGRENSERFDWFAPLNAAAETIRNLAFRPSR